MLMPQMPTPLMNSQAIANEQDIHQLNASANPASQPMPEAA